MTLAKRASVSSLRVGSNGATPKRAVSFSSSCCAKFDAPEKSPEINAKCDGDLQSSDKRRRYQRRGSKSASMLMMAGLNLKSLEECCSSPDMDMVKSQRRLSLMSALKLSLERATILDSQKSLQMKQMTSEERRMSTYELLSQL